MGFSGGYIGGGVGKDAECVQFGLKSENFPYSGKNSSY